MALITRNLVNHATPSRAVTAHHSTAVMSVVPYVLYIKQLSASSGGERVT